MKPTDRELILASIGLKPHMVWRENEPPIYRKEDFTNYVERSYRDSTVAESDRVYRMFELVWLHNDSGVRVKVTTSDSRAGDVCDYRVHDVFILAADGKREEVLGIDMVARKVIIREGAVPFAEVNKHVDRA